MFSRRGTYSDLWWTAAALTLTWMAGNLVVLAVGFLGMWPVPETAHYVNRGMYITFAAISAAVIVRRGGVRLGQGARWLGVAATFTVLLVLFEVLGLLSVTAAVLLVVFVASTLNRHGGTHAPPS